MEPTKQTLKLEAGKYYRTRVGKKAFVAGINPFDNQASYPFVGFINSEEHSSEQTWDADGRFRNDIDNHNFDLVAIWVEPKRIKGWVAVSARTTGDMKPTPEDAIAAFMDYGPRSSILAVVEIDVLEGAGLGEVA